MSHFISTYNKYFKVSIWYFKPFSLKVVIFRELISIHTSHTWLLAMRQGDCITSDIFSFEKKKSLYHLVAIWMDQKHQIWWFHLQRFQSSHNCIVIYFNVTYCDHNIIHCNMYFILFVLQYICIILYCSCIYNANTFSLQYISGIHTALYNWSFLFLFRNIFCKPGTL